MDIIDILNFEYLLNTSLGFIQSVYSLYIQSFIEPHLPLIKNILNTLSALFIAGIVFVFIKFKEVQKKERALYMPVDTKALETKNRITQWDVVLNHLDAENPAEWKLAVIEADNVLERTLRDVGYAGDTLGERLKSAEGGNLRTLSDAWEAHKVRNRIAHEEGFDLSQRGARKAIGLFENVLGELGAL
ncbi:MAG: hypothetical protein BMS9Abin13_588 [Patescibacteria group bacterium]|nr:MAG: hypothetical protein BMS9Abin13_588 [Patescibacteria group bacterium]